jgi:hypothetical protein
MESSSLEPATGSGPPPIKCWLTVAQRPGPDPPAGGGRNTSSGPHEANVRLFHAFRARGKTTRLTACNGAGGLSSHRKVEDVRKD